ncbi:MAG: hypothetical protein LBJ31_03460 [Treponema sp.]|nr:hypothetical protein [Treponema sp.]
MEDSVINNLVYLIPIAFIIAARILGSGAKKREQEKRRAANTELVKKINEARANPSYAGALTEDTLVHIPPARPLLKQSAERVIWPSTPVVTKKSPVKYTAPKNQDVTPEKTDAVAPETAAPDRLAHLAPLQQAVVWAEILGTPRGM